MILKRGCHCIQLLELHDRDVKSDPIKLYSLHSISLDFFHCDGLKHEQKLKFKTSTNLVRNATEYLNCDSCQSLIHSSFFFLLSDPLSSSCKVELIYTAAFSMLEKTKMLDSQGCPSAFSWVEDTTTSWSEAL